MKTTIAMVFLLVAALTMPATAQLAPPNAAGIRMGHIHLVVSDVPAQQKFWATLGGVATANQRLEMIQFPGVFILLRGGQTKGGTAGSIVNHIGFVWKDLPAAMAKWQAAGYKIEQDKPTHGYILGPDGIRLEFSGDPSLQVPVKINHVHLYPQDVPAMKSWYAKALGGVSGKCVHGEAPDDGMDCVEVPGVSLAMSPSDTKLEPTLGRSLDHIGFEVKNLPEFLARMQAEGVSITQPLTQSNFVTTMRVAFITDPWGTRMEITEGLAP